MERLKLASVILGLIAMCLLVGHVVNREPVAYHFELAAAEGGTIPTGLAAVLSGNYAPGAKVKLVERSMQGYGFSHWTSSDGGEFDDPEDSGATFIMPENDVIVTAHYERLN